VIIINNLAAGLISLTTIAGTAELADFQRKPMKNNSLFLILRKAMN